MKKTREQRIANGTLVPNSFQHPNMYPDWLHFYLAPEEVVVLDKAIREILGWEDNISDRKARIALSIFVDGKTSRKTGNQLCLGCGLGIQAVRKALAALDKYRVLVREGPPTQEGQMWRLQDRTELIDWAGLEERRERWDAANLRRTARATKASLYARGVTSDVRGNVGRNPKPSGMAQAPTTTSGVPSDDSLTSDVQTLVTSDVNNETQKDLSDICDTEFLDPAWPQFLNLLQASTSRDVWNTYWLTARLVSVQNGTWTVQVAGPRMVEWIVNRILPSHSFKSLVARAAPHVQNVEIVAREQAGVQ